MLIAGNKGVVTKGYIGDENGIAQKFYINEYQRSSYTTNLKRGTIAIPDLPFQSGGNTSCDSIGDYVLIPASEEGYRTKLTTYNSNFIQGSAPDSINDYSFYRYRNNGEYLIGRYEYYTDQLVHTVLNEDIGFSPWYRCGNYIINNITDLNVNPSTNTALSKNLVVSTFSFSVSPTRYDVGTGETSDHSYVIYVGGTTISSSGNNYQRTETTCINSNLTASSGPSLKVGKRNARSGNNNKYLFFLSGYGQTTNNSFSNIEAWSNNLVNQTVTPLSKNMLNLNSHMCHNYYIIYYNNEYASYDDNLVRTVIPSSELLLYHSDSAASFTLGNKTLIAGGGVKNVEYYESKLTSVTYTPRESVTINF